MKPSTRRQNTLYLALTLLLVIAIGTISQLIDSDTPLLPAASHEIGSIEKQNLSTSAINTDNSDLQIDSAPVASSETHSKKIANAPQQIQTKPTTTDSRRTGTTAATTPIKQSNENAITQTLSADDPTNSGHDTDAETKADEVTKAEKIAGDVTDKEPEMADETSAQDPAEDVDISSPSLHPTSPPIMIVDARPAGRTNTPSEANTAPLTLPTNPPAVTAPLASASIPALNTPADISPPFDTSTPLIPMPNETLITEKIVSIPEPGAGKLFTAGLLLLVIFTLYRRRIIH